MAADTLYTVYDFIDGNCYTKKGKLNENILSYVSFYLSVCVDDEQRIITG